MPESLIGPGCTAQMGCLFNDHDWKRPLIITTTGIMKRGQLRNLEKSLASAGVQYVVFDKILPDPTFDVCRQGFGWYIHH